MTAIKGMDLEVMVGTGKRGHFPEILRKRTNRTGQHKWLRTEKQAVLGDPVAAAPQVQGEVMGGATARGTTNSRAWREPTPSPAWRGLARSRCSAKSGQMKAE